VGLRRGVVEERKNRRMMNTDRSTRGSLLVYRLGDIIFRWTPQRRTITLEDLQGLVNDGFISGFYTSFEIKEALNWLRRENYILYSYSKDGLICKSLSLTSQGCEKFASALTSKNLKFEFLGFNLAEAITLLTTFYLIAICFFNVGYFQIYGFEVVNLFSLPELVTPNFHVLSLLLSAYTMISIIIFIVELIGIQYLNENIKKFKFIVYIKDTFLFAVDRFDRRFVYLWLMLVLLFIISLIDGPFKNRNTGYITSIILFLTIVPQIIFEHTERGSVGGKTIFLIAFTLGFSSYNIGRTTSKYDQTEKTTSLYLKSGSCIDRVLVKASSAGYLMFSKSINNIEYRSKDEITVMYFDRKCSN
jgi:hypothetical protein